jgi:hypothetical protein
MFVIEGLGVNCVCTRVLVCIVVRGCFAGGIGSLNCFWPVNGAGCCNNDPLVGVFLLVLLVALQKVTEANTWAYPF